MDELLERLEELDDARSSVGGEESSDTETHATPVNQPHKATNKTRKELPHGNSESGLYPTNSPKRKPRSSKGVTNGSSTNNKVACSFLGLSCIVTTLFGINTDERANENLDP